MGSNDVDREALVEQAMHLFTRLWASDTTAGQAVDAVRSTVELVLAARGDAATPTEVKWGVRSRGGEVRRFHTEEQARAEASRLLTVYGYHATLVQRTVSAWREV